MQAAQLGHSRDPSPVVVERQSTRVLFVPARVPVE
jgi:hypothetical protein